MEKKKSKYSKLDKFFIILGILLLITIFILFEKFIFFICKLISYFKLLAIILDVILHLLFIRFVVIQVSFAGRNKILNKINRFNQGCMHANYLIETLINIQNDLKHLHDKPSSNSNSYYSRLRNNLNHYINTINSYMCTYSQIQTKFGKLSKCQNEMYFLLSNFSKQIEESKILNFLDTKIKKKGSELINIDKENSSEDTIGTNDLSSSSIELNVSNFIYLYESIGSIVCYLQDYLCAKAKFISLKKIKYILYNDLFCSLEQYRVDLDDSFEYDEYKLKTKDNKIIDYIILKKYFSDEAYYSDEINDQINTSNNKKLMIICGPNGAPFEAFAKNIHLEYYLNKGVDVLLWNYRGFGYSTGSSSFSNLRSDVLELYDHIESLKKYDKIGVHGISIGGIPCCHLAAKRKKICLLVSDRNFCNMELIVNALPFGNILKIIYFCLVLPSSYTISDYMNANCYKIVLNDPNDQIVKESASLKTNTSKYFINNVLYKDTSNVIHDNELLNEKIIFSSKNNVNSNINLDANYPTIDPSRICNLKYNLDGLDLLLNDKQSKELFINNLIDISEMLNKGILNGIPKYTLIQKIKNKFNKQNYYLNLREEELQNTSGVFDFIKNRLTDFFEKFESSGDLLSRLNEINTTRMKIIFIKNFFSNLLVWGNKFYQCNEREQCHYFSTINIDKTFNDAINLLENFLMAQEVQNFKNLKIIEDVNVLINFFKQIVNNLTKINFKSRSPLDNLMNNSDSFCMINNQHQKESSNFTNIRNSNDHNTFYENMIVYSGRGNLIGLNCGHNGSLQYDEIDTFKHQLESSKFFDNRGMI